MIYIEKNYLDLDVSEILQLRKDKLSTLLIKGLKSQTERTRSEVDGYKSKKDGKSKKDRLREKLEKLYDKKCAYCERKKGLGEKYEIEHYRSQKLYYWLAYEWSNLLLSCSQCNAPDAKGSDFPLLKGGKRMDSPFFPNQNWKKHVAKLVQKGGTDKIEDWEKVWEEIIKEENLNLDENRKKWIANHSQMLAEKPVWLNPEVDHPENYLLFLPDGKIEAKEQKEKEEKKRAQQSIDNYNLNHKGLVEKRHKKIKVYQRQLENLCEQFKEQIRKKLVSVENVEKKLTQHFRQSLKGLFQEQKQSAEFSRVGWHMVDEFEKFLPDGFPYMFKDILLSYFQDHRKELEQEFERENQSSSQEKTKEEKLTEERQEIFKKIEKQMIPFLIPNRSIGSEKEEGLVESTGTLLTESFSPLFLELAAALNEQGSKEFTQLLKSFKFQSLISVILSRVGGLRK